MSAAESAAEPLLLRTRSEGLETLTLNRPERQNALSGALLAELRAALDAIAEDESVRVVVLAARGRAFSAGHDLEEMRDERSEAAYRALFERCSGVMLALRRMPQTVVARVQGVATAAGCQLVASCDLAVASEDARLATSGIDVGLFCSTPAVAVSRAVAPKRAYEMLATGRFLDARTAEAWGLLNRVVPAAELDAELERLVETLLAKPPAALRSGKRLFERQLGLGLDAAYADAGAVMARDAAGEELAEGIDAFRAKRPPKWPGR